MAGPAMTEEELLLALMDTLALRRATTHDTVAQHVRRSDLALVVGIAGLPDIVGVVGHTLIAWELKAESGRMSADQWEWHRRLGEVDAIDVRTVRPSDLDELVGELLGHRLVGRRGIRQTREPRP
jgi:hypothetical protein